MRLGRYRKAIVAAVGAAAATLVAAYADDVFSASEGGELIAQGIALALTLYGIWRVPNERAAPAPRVTSTRTL